MLHRSFHTEGQLTDYPAEFSAAAVLKVLPLASANLGSPDKALRLATLRVLSYFEPLSDSHEDGTQIDTKRQKLSNGSSKDRDSNQPSKVYFSPRSLLTMTLMLYR